MSKPPLSWLLPVLGLLAGYCSACNNPVCQEAYDKWEPERYSFVVFHRDALRPPHDAVLKQLQSLADASEANLDLHSLDLNAPDAQLLDDLKLTLGQPVSALLKDATLPHLLVFAPRILGTAPGAPLWSGPLTQADTALLLDSPLRQELARKLAQRHATVWLLLESGSKDADQKALDTTRQALEQLRAHVQQNSESSEAGDPAFPEETPAAKEKPQIAWLKLDASSPKEQWLVRLLEQVQPGEPQPKRPALYPLFGRGRVLAGLDEITPEIIARAGDFLYGPCFCSVKESRPGFDILIKSDWSAASSAAAEAAVTQLPGPDALAGVAQAQLPALPPVTPEAFTEQPPALWNVLALTLAGLVVLAAVLSLYLMRRR